MIQTCPKCHSENTDTDRFCSNCATALGAASRFGQEIATSFSIDCRIWKPTPVTEMTLVQNWLEELKRLVPVK